MYSSSRELPHHYSRVIVSWHSLTSQDSIPFLYSPTRERMAHKHNRRRVRHRTRRNRYEQNLPTLYESSSYDSLSSFSEPRVAVDTRVLSRPSSTSWNLSDASILRDWLDMSKSNWSRGPSTSSLPLQVYNEEVKAMRTFGGELGDDIGLCGKMQEMFDSMEWMHT